MNKPNISLNNSHFFFETNVFQDITVTYEEPIIGNDVLISSNVVISKVL